MERTFALDDVEYLAKDLRMWHIGRTSGVINATSNDFNTTVGVGMQTIVGEGYAHVQCGTTERGGVVYGNLTPLTINHDGADSVLDRYDAIVIRYSRTENNCKIVNVKGANASKPTKYKPTRNSDVFELVLKYVKVPHGISAITPSLIEDAILDENVCGLAVDNLAKIPTAQYNSQINSFIQEQNDLFLNWFDSVKGKMDGDVGTRLTQEVTELQNLVADMQRQITNLTSRVERQETRISSGTEEPTDGQDGDIYFQI